MRVPFVYIFLFNLLPLNVQYYSPDELNRRYEKTSSIGSKRVVSRTGRNNVIYLHNYFCSHRQCSDLIRLHKIQIEFFFCEENFNPDKDIKNVENVLKIVHFTFSVIQIFDGYVSNLNTENQAASFNYFWIFFMLIIYTRLVKIQKQRNSVYSHLYIVLNF